MKLTRLAALFLALFLAITPALAYPQNALVPYQENYGTGFPDVKGAWCERYVQTVYESSLMEGKTKTSFEPRALLTNAQIMAISARLHDLLTGGDGEIPLIADASWYLTYYNHMAPLLDYESGTEILNMGLWPPTEACTRLDFISLLCVVLEAAKVELPVLNQISCIPDFSPVEAGETYDDVLGFYNAGILVGADEYGSLRAFSSLTRGEAAAMLARLIDPAQRLKASPKPFDFCGGLLGVSRDTVVYTVNGQDLTMADFAPELAQNFFAGETAASVTFAGATVPDSVSQALAFLRVDLATAVLAEQAGLTLSPEAEAAAAAQARTLDGFAGLDEALWLPYCRQEALAQAVEDYYYQTYGYTSPLFQSNDPDGSSHLFDDRNAAEAGLVLQSTGVLDGLDWAAIGERAKATPYAQYFFQSAV